MDENQKDKTQAVYSQVTAALEDQGARELWHRLRSELTREGARAAVKYLESELIRMKEEVQRELDLMNKTQGD